MWKKKGEKTSFWVLMHQIHSFSSHSKSQVEQKHASYIKNFTNTNNRIFVTKIVLITKLPKLHAKHLKSFLQSQVFTKSLFVSTRKDCHSRRLLLSIWMSITQWSMVRGHFLVSLFTNDSDWTFPLRLTRYWSHFLRTLCPIWNTFILGFVFLCSVLA